MLRTFVLIAWAKFSEEDAENEAIVRIEGGYGDHREATTKEGLESSKGWRKLKFSRYDDDIVELFDKAAEYWVQALKLAPDNYPRARNWLRITGRAKSLDSF